VTRPVRDAHVLARDDVLRVNSQLVADVIRERPVHDMHPADIPAGFPQAGDQF
jgi:hypothetical protein